MEKQFSLFLAFTHIRLLFRSSDSPFTLNYCKHRQKEFISFLKSNYVVTPYAYDRPSDFQITFYDLPISKTQVIHKSHLGVGNGKSYFAYIFSQNGKAVGIPYSVSTSHIAYIILKLLLTQLSKQSAFILHASSNIFHDALLLFVAPSGGGKSTITTLLDKKFPSFSDEYIVIKKQGNSYVGSRLGLKEKKHILSRKKLERQFLIHATLFLRKGVHTQLKLVDRLDAINKLTPQLLTADDGSIQPIQIQELYSFVQIQRNFYQLTFPKKQTLVEFISKSL